MQTYHDTLQKRNEIILEDKTLMRPKFAQIERAHGLPKIHTDCLYQDTPPFRHIVDTTSTPHYGIGKYLSSLLNPFTINNYSIEDSFLKQLNVEKPFLPDYSVMDKYPLASMSPHCLLIPFRNNS